MRTLLLKLLRKKSSRRLGKYGIRILLSRLLKRFEILIMESSFLLLSLPIGGAFQAVRAI
jgi:hypothetical protein